MSEAPPAPIIQKGEKGKKEAPSLGVLGAEEVSTTVDCIHIPRAMKGASIAAEQSKKAPGHYRG
jgi:hypothetical protein